MTEKTDYIGVFDSGVGGISVLRELIACMPNERFLYFGDSANAPYGTKPKEQIRQLALNNAKLLMDYNVKAIVVACNTATAMAIDLLRQTYPDTIIIGIEPAIKPAVRQFPQGTLAIMATPATLQGEKLQRLMALHPHDRLLKIPAPGMVELVEAGLSDSPQMDDFLHNLLDPYVGKLDGLVLGCTHYPFAVQSIRRVLGDKTVLFDGGAGTARETRRRLAEKDLLSDGKGEVRILNSSADSSILQLCNTLLTEDL